MESYRLINAKSDITTPSTSLMSCLPTLPVCAKIMKFAEDVAARSGCKSLRLCTGIENEDGIRFYDRNGWTKRAFAYAKRLT